MIRSFRPHIAIDTVIHPYTDVYSYTDEDTEGQLDPLALCKGAELS